MQSVAELVELPARVAELASLLHKEREARARLEAHFRKADQSSLDALVEDRLEMEAMKLRAEFAAEFPKHRQAITRLQDSRDAAQAQRIKSIVQSEFQQLVAREEQSLAALRAEIRGEVQVQLKDGLGVVCGTQDDWLRELVAEQLAPLQQRLDAAEAALQRLQADAAEAAEMEAVVLERLDAVAQAVADEDVVQLPAEVADSILGLRRDVEQLRVELCTTNRMASQATAKCEAALASLEMTVAETAAQDKRFQSSEARQIAECQAVRESADAAVAKVEDAVAARLEELDDLVMAHGAKLLRVLSVVGEWEAGAPQATPAPQTSDREAGVDDPQTLRKMQVEAAKAAEAALKPLAEQLELVDRNARETVAELALQLEARPWAHALDLSDNVDALRSELAVSLQHIVSAELLTFVADPCCCPGMQ